MKTPMQILLSELNQFPEGREALKKTRWEELLERAMEITPFEFAEAYHKQEVEAISNKAIKEYSGTDIFQATFKRGMEYLKNKLLKP